MTVPPLTAREALSGLCGSVTLAAWIFVLVPQLIENYRLGRADGISLIFLSVWLVGDISNLIGALWAGLVPTVIAVAIYFCFADVVLYSQCVYYNYLNSEKSEARDAVDDEQGDLDDPEQPLLSRENSHPIGLPGSRRPSTASKKHRDSHGSIIPNSNVENLFLEQHSSIRSWVTNTLGITFVISLGTLGWLLAWQTGAWTPVPLKQEKDKTSTPFGAEILGYLSAVCYLGARIPQIIKNFQLKSCEGLSLLFFMLSTLGNIAYGAQILFHSTKRPYVLTNLPWLIGSLGTIAEDVIIFIQFRMYHETKPRNALT